MCHRLHSSHHFVTALKLRHCILRQALCTRDTRVSVSYFSRQIIFAGALIVLVCSLGLCVTKPISAHNVALVNGLSLVVGWRGTLGQSLRTIMVPEIEYVPSCWSVFE
jgi:hypothetical protein